MFDIFNKSGLDLGPLENLIQNFMPFAQERHGFKNPPKLFLLGDEENAANPLGKTGGYDPGSMEVTIYVSGRHPKDILRSLSHELVHHNQNERGDFSDAISTALGYAQDDPHMREMEREAYEQGNLCFRDWEDGRKKQLQESIYYETVIGGEDMSKKIPLKEWKDNEVHYRLMKKFGLLKEEGDDIVFKELDVVDEKRVAGASNNDEDDIVLDEDEDPESINGLEESVNESLSRLSNEATQLLNEQWWKRSLEKVIPRPYKPGGIADELTPVKPKRSGGIWMPRGKQTPIKTTPSIRGPVGGIESLEQLPPAYLKSLGIVGGIPSKVRVTNPPAVGPAKTSMDQLRDLIPLPAEYLTRLDPMSAKAPVPEKIQTPYLFRDPQRGMPAKQRWPMFGPDPNVPHWWDILKYGERGEWPFISTVDPIGVPQQLRPAQVSAPLPKQAPAEAATQAYETPREKEWLAKTLEPEYPAKMIKQQRKFKEPRWGHPGKEFTVEQLKMWETKLDRGAKPSESIDELAEKAGAGDARAIGILNDLGARLWNEYELGLQSGMAGAPLRHPRSRAMATSGWALGGAGLGAALGGPVGAGVGGVLGGLGGFSARPHYSYKKGALTYAHRDWWKWAAAAAAAGIGGAELYYYLKDPYRGGRPGYPTTEYEWDSETETGTTLENERRGSIINMPVRAPKEGESGIEYAPHLNIGKTKHTPKRDDEKPSYRDAPQIWEELYESLELDEDRYNALFEGIKEIWAKDSKE
jgi:hypothetical protein